MLARLIASRRKVEVNTAVAIHVTSHEDLSVMTALIGFPGRDREKDLLANMVLEGRFECIGDKRLHPTRHCTEGQMGILVRCREHERPIHPLAPSAIHSGLLLLDSLERHQKDIAELGAIAECRIDIQFDGHFISPSSQGEWQRREPLTCRKEQIRRYI